jgi:hypothetical protein
MRLWSINDNKKQIEQMLSHPPSSWQKIFRQMGLSDTPNIKEVLNLLDYTAGGNSSNETMTSNNNPKNLVPPDKVREEAMKGIILSYQNNYPSYKGIGLARAIQLATQPTIWQKSVDRMRAFFNRNKRYETIKGFNDDHSPTKSYLAYLNWGGISGKNWVMSL